MHCKESRLQLTYQWKQAVWGYMVRELLPFEVMGTVAAVTHSQVNRPASAVTEHEPTSSAEADNDCETQEAVPVFDLSTFQQCCAAAYELILTVRMSHSQ